MRISGSITIARASATRRAIPPDKLGRHHIGRATQTHRVQFGQHHMTNQAIGELGVLAQREGDIFEDAEVGQQRTVLEQHAESLPHADKAR